MRPYSPMVGLTLEAAEPGYDPLAQQAKVQNTIFASAVAKGRVPNRNRAERAQTIEELLGQVRHTHEAMGSEHQEVLDFLPWKDWKETGPDPSAPLESLGDLLTEIQYESVDKLLLLMNDFLALGMTWNDVMDMCKTKQNKNIARQESGY